MKREILLVKLQQRLFAFWNNTVMDETRQDLFLVSVYRVNYTYPLFEEKGFCKKNGGQWYGAK